MMLGADQVCIYVSSANAEFDDAAEQNNSDEPTLDEKFEKMSGVKRTTVRVLSAVAFLALVALAVYGTDAITGFIKGLFS